MRRASFSSALFPAGFVVPASGLTSPLYSPVRLASTASSAKGAPVVNLYKRLRVDPSASPDELKAAYRQRALECHPDVVDEPLRAQAEVDFRAVSEAYDTLMDAEKRAAHDRALGLARAPPTRAESAAPDPPRDRDGGRRRARRPFVRGDADRMFRAAFDGLSLDEVLFRARQRQRQRQRQRPRGDSRDSRDSRESGGAAGAEEAMRRVVADAAERFATRVRRQYGPGVLARSRLRVGGPAGPSPPPADAMPFRPFIGWTLPPGVRAPPEPVQGPASHVSKERVLVDETQTLTQRTVPRHFPRVEDTEDAGSQFSEMVQKMEKTQGMPNNMGQLYSFHRPY